MEESYGCLIGTYARDKDAISAVAALCEAAAYYKMKGMPLWDAMVAMYEKLMYFYGKIGFKPLNDTDGKFYGDMVLSIDEFKDYPK